MRALQRPELETRLIDYLRDWQLEIDSGSEVVATWKAQRKSASMKRVINVLRQMTGKRERCMYCEDSRGIDVEHFWPKLRYPARAFRWPNLLWACAGCNRVKIDRFPRDETGEPLLIDPTDVDPWDYLFYDPETDELTPRWDPRTRRQHPKGLVTLEILSTLSHQAVAESRRRTCRNLQRALRAFFGTPETSEAEAELRESISDNDDFGLAVWFFLREGQEEEPFAELQRRYPEVWERMRAYVANMS